MKLTPSISFNGDCAAALDFYKVAAGAVVKDIVTFGATPAAPHVPTTLHDLIFFASLRIGETEVIAGDSLPEKWSGAPTGYRLHISTDTSEEADRLFAAMGEGGKVEIAMCETFFAHRLSRFVDKFGVPWLIMHGKSRP